MRHGWLYVSEHDLKIEQAQLEQEGKAIPAALVKEFRTLSKVDLHQPKNQQRATELLEASVRLPLRKDYPYREPSDLESIRKERPKRVSLPAKRMTRSRMEDHFLGAWLGRCAGCLLGKPVEGMKSDAIRGYLTALNQFPLSDYFSAKAPKKTLEKYGVNPRRPFIENVSCMVEDDDTNYTVTGLVIMKRHGRDFQPHHVADFWMNNLPILHTCTAERIAYRNFVIGIDPPASASYVNPYREWIGAQIRADFFGYAALGNPQLAAEFAWRDACISHIKNGIYGEMWVAAMLAAAPFWETPDEVVAQGLMQVPKASRLAERVAAVRQWYRQGVSYDDAVAKIHQEWNEYFGHDWCHTISNAMLVTVGLLWGELDYERSICRAVQPGFDTDCNGATVGSIVGMMLGAKKLPTKWISPLNDRLQTGVHGYFEVSLSELAKETCVIHKAVTA